jgi:hypothetical protein
MAFPWLPVAAGALLLAALAFLAGRFFRARTVKAPAAALGITQGTPQAFASADGALAFEGPALGLRTLPRPWIATLPDNPSILSTEPDHG